MGQFIGVDIHRKFLQVCVMDAEGVVSEELRLEMDEPKAIEQFFSRFAEGTPVVVEATCGWMWLADLLESVQDGPDRRARVGGPAAHQLPA